MRAHPEIEAAARDHPEQAARLARLRRLGPEATAAPGRRAGAADGLARARGDARAQRERRHAVDARAGDLAMLLPRKASDTVVHAFLQHGASVWVLRASQVGGHHPDVERSRR